MESESRCETERRFITGVEGARPLSGDEEGAVLELAVVAPLTLGIAFDLTFVLLLAVFGVVTEALLPISLPELFLVRPVFGEFALAFAPALSGETGCVIVIFEALFDLSE